MSQMQERQDDKVPPPGRMRGEQAPGRRSGEGAASALEQVSQDRRRQQEDPGESNEAR
jgi:hypothetical protein